LDGTLGDSYASLSAGLKYVYSRLEEARSKMESSPEDVDPALSSPTALWPLNDDGKILDPVLEKYHAQLKEGANHFPEVYDILYQFYSQGRRMALTSRKPIRLTERLARNLGLDEFFEGIYGPDSVGDNDPHSGMILRAMQDLGVRREEVLFVGDQPDDVAAARAADVRIALITSVASRSAYAIEAPDYLVDNWPQLLSLPV
jgi:phosphoglycolate phosphatase